MPFDCLFNTLGPFHARWRPTLKAARFRRNSSYVPCSKALTVQLAALCCTWLGSGAGLGAEAILQPAERTPDEEGWIPADTFDEAAHTVLQADLSRQVAAQAEFRPESRHTWLKAPAEYLKGALLEESISDEILRRSNVSAADKAAAAFLKLREPAIKTLAGVVGRLAMGPIRELVFAQGMPSNFILHGTSVHEGGAGAGDMLEVDRKAHGLAATRHAQDPKEAEDREERERYEARQRNMDIMVMCVFVVQELIALYVAFTVGEAIPDMTEEDERDPERYRNWSDKPLDCCAEPKLCCLSCFCPCVVFGMTTQRVGCEPLDQFWKGCVAFWAISLLAALVGLLGMILIGTLVFAVRRRVKDQYAFQTQNDRLSDFALSCCCPILAIAQEARHLERSKKAGFSFMPFLNWPEGHRPRDGARGIERGGRGGDGSVLTGQPVAVTNRISWGGDFRGARGSIADGLVGEAAEENDKPSDSDAAAKQLGA